MFKLYSHHQAYLQSLVELYMLNAHAMWDSSSEEKNFTGGIKNMNHSVGQKQTKIKYTELRRIMYAACSQ
jgi:hypothetical protein